MLTAMQGMVAPKLLPGTRLLFFISILTIGAIAEAQQQNWKKFRDDFLNDDLPTLISVCKRGKQDNRKGLSAFNNQWVKQIRTLRIDAGVSTVSPEASNDYFAGLSAAMHQHCPGVW